MNNCIIKISENVQVILIDCSFDFDDFDVIVWEVKYGRLYVGIVFLKKIVNDIKSKVEMGYLLLDLKIDNF